MRQCNLLKLSFIVGASVDFDEDDNDASRHDEQTQPSARPRTSVKSLLPLRGDTEALVHQLAKYGFARLQ